MLCPGKGFEEKLVKRHGRHDVLRDGFSFHLSDDSFAGI